MLAELHTHTKNSVRTKVYFDGVNTTEQIVRRAKRLGLGAIAITDHDNMAGLKNARKLEKKYDIIVIKGEEVTTKKGHILAHGIQEEIPKGLSVNETIDLIHQQGGIATAAHPFDIRREGVRHECKKCDAIEVFSCINMERLANRKARKVAEKLKKPMVAGSDAHSVKMVGYALTKMDADSIDSILKAIKKGKTEVIGRYVPFNIIIDVAIRKLQLSYNHTNRYINEHYRQPKRFLARNMLGLVKHSPGKVDYFIKTLFYIGMSCVYVYSFSREIKDIF